MQPALARWLLLSASRVFWDVSCHFMSSRMRADDDVPNEPLDQLAVRKPPGRRLHPPSKHPSNNTRQKAVRRLLERPRPQYLTRGPQVGTAQVSEWWAVSSLPLVPLHDSLLEPLEVLFVVRGHLRVRHLALAAICANVLRSSGLSLALRAAAPARPPRRCRSSRISRAPQPP
jgi:hypothetical protein